MVFTDTAIEYFSLIGSRVRAGFAESNSATPFYYEEESFHSAYEVMTLIWKRRQSIRSVAEKHAVSRDTVKNWQQDFVRYGAIGLLAEITSIPVDSLLERLVVLIKTVREHEHSNYALRLAEALQIPGASLDIIRRIHRCWGYGQRHDENDRAFYSGLQKIMASIEFYKSKERKPGHDPQRKAQTFFPRDCRDSFQHKVELFKELSLCEKKRHIRPALRRYGVYPDRYYQLRERFMSYGVWGLVDLVHASKRVGEKISPELELQIIEERLKNPALSATRIMEKLDLKCCRANVQKIYSRWKLSSFKDPITIHGVISTPIPEGKAEKPFIEQSAKLRFPELIQKAGLKVNRGFESFAQHLRYRSIHICNPGAILIAPFVHQLGIIEALHTYGPPKFRTQEITNNIIVNILRIIAGFPTIHDFRINSDLSVAIGAGLTITPKKSRFYDSFDDLRFNHLLKLRTDLARRAKESDIIEGKEIAIDYHCDPSDSRYPLDKSFSKAPDKKGDLVYAHRPQIIWDSTTHSIINIAYCEGRSRATTALYRFLEDNLYKIIEPTAIKEIYADSEYTGERQLVYLHIRSESQVTMCLKQNKKIVKWREETIAHTQWQPYGEKYHIASRDFILSSGIPFRFVVKQNTETAETRCFGSTHCNWSPMKILNSYHLRWPVETGIKDLAENYFLNKPTGTSAEKSECHYYCVMASRLAIDLFLENLAEARWKSPEGWRCVLSTVRSTLFSDQNCELSLDDSGDLLVTYLDGDANGIKRRLKSMFERLNELDHWRVPWWNNRAIRISVEDQSALFSGPEIRN